MIACRINESFLLYASCSYVCTGVVLVYVVLGWDLLPLLMMRADVPHMFLKDLSLTTISVPASINLVMCLFIVSEAWC